MRLEDFLTQNVWWQGKERLADDKHIRDFSGKTYRWEPGILKEDIAPGNVFTLRGPRQVGKTTLVKLLIRKIIEGGAPEKSVFYASCDTMVDYRELLSLVREYLEFARSNNLGETRIFLDEVSGIENWQKAIKHLADSGELGHSAVFLTGSHTLDIKHGFEKLPGRTGKLGRDYLLLPLSFGEFVGLVRPEIRAKVPCIKALSVDEFNKAANGALPFDRELKLLFNQYMTTGGFPLAINEFYAEKTIPDYVYEIYLRWVIGDMARWGKQERILKQVLRTAISKEGTATSWDSFAKEAEIKSHKTVSSYVEDLENMFVFFVLHFMDLNGKTADYNKNKKIYFFDPLIHQIFNRAFYFRNAEITPARVEAAVAVHFARYSGIEKADESVFYWKNKRETDIVVKTGERLFAVEVKHQEKISRDDFESLYRFGEGILATKSVLKAGVKYSSIPVHLLLAVLR